jgi:hypothetical protein
MIAAQAIQSYRVLFLHASSGNPPITVILSLRRRIPEDMVRSDGVAGDSSTLAGFQNDLTEFCSGCDHSKRLDQFENWMYKN